VVRSLGSETDKGASESRFSGAGAGVGSCT